MLSVIEIDGSYGEGGGQILRTSLALSILTQRPLRIHRIRAGRKVPGLRPQHLASAQAARKISDGRLKGAELGSTEITFYPGTIQPGSYTFDVSDSTASAGSTTLIFQTVLMPLGFARTSSQLTLKGGTHVPWSPSADYLAEVFLPAIARMGTLVKIKAPRKGFYPVGGGILEATIHPFETPLNPLNIPERGRLRQIRIISAAANLPISIARRQLDQATRRLKELGLQALGQARAEPSPGKGTFCFIEAEFEHLRAGFSALGEIGKPAEQVADEAVEEFLRFWKGNAAADPHLADQVALYAALANGESALTVSQLTEHLKTNIWVIEQFLPVKFRIEPDPSSGLHRIHVRGMAWTLSNSNL